MPEYEYECKTCGALLIFSRKMEDPKPKALVIPHYVRDEILARMPQGSMEQNIKREVDALPCEDATFERVFSIPGMTVHYEDTWVVRGPGGLANDRRDKAWRDRFAKD